MMVESAPDRVGSSAVRQPIYSPRQISSASFLGGPIALVYFLRKNFQTLGNTAAAAQCLGWGILFNVVILGSMPFLPKRFPNYVLPLAYSWTAYFIAEQKQLSKESISASSQFCFQSNWKVFGLAIAFSVGTFLIWLIWLSVWMN
jgi:hypothetical protein